MKQIILPFNTGKPLLEDVPAPAVQPGYVLIRTKASVVSPGTERMLMEFGKAGWIGKLQQQPEKVREVINKIRTDGLNSTINAVRRKLDSPISLGYSQAGIVLDVGAGISDIRIGDRVASNGSHAEVVSVPRNLVAKIPDEVSDEDAAFTVLGAIALQGIRLAEPTLGETVVVFGLGLIGQLCAQLLLANGCRVIGIDLHPERLQKAASKGVEIISVASGDAVRALTGGYGADAVIITAASESDKIMQQAADMCRKRGRIVLTGVVGLKLNRDHFFKKELSFQVSGSYGPGRYEPGYEQKGVDYPIGYVRWTEGRNFEAVLQAMKTGRLDVSSLVSHRTNLKEFETVYDDLGDPGQLASIFLYDDIPDSTTKISSRTRLKPATGRDLGIIGAGNYTAAILLPALVACGASIKSIVSRNGLSATTLARKFEINEACTDHTRVLSDDDICAVVITTPHNTHSALTAAALQAGKHVFVEKPLALTDAETQQVEDALNRSNATLTVGFNRRFAPLAVKARALLDGLSGPMNIVVTVNAGALPRDHWIQDESIGGGRIIGEACHFIDLCSFFAGHRIVEVSANNMSGQEGLPAENASVLLRFADGSNAVVNYFSNGSKSYDKERIELYRTGHTIVIENWRTLRSFGFKKDLNIRKTQDKGHKELLAAWLQSLESNKAALIPADQLFNSTRATIAAVNSMLHSSRVSI